MKRLVYATEMPQGYLKTTRMNCPSIKTDDQMNALEALEIAITAKFDQFDKFMDRQYYLTSAGSWSGRIEVYPSGYYINLEGTRSGFQAFVSGDNVIRKPRMLGDMEGYYNVNGDNGQVYFMSARRNK